MGDQWLDIKWLGLSRRGAAVDRRGQPAAHRVAAARAADSAWEIAVEGGIKRAPVPAAHPPGTRVEVRDLFFATPARLKFLKTARSERDYALDAVRRLAMACPQIGFTVIGDDERVLLRLPPAMSREDRLGGAARPRFRREFGAGRGVARRVFAVRADRLADPEPRLAARPVSRRQLAAGARQTAGRRGARRLSRSLGARPPPGRRAVPRRAGRTRSTSTCIRPRPRSASATRVWCAG